MKKPLTALLLTSALVIPAAPAGAFGVPDLPGGDQVQIERCSKTRYGVTVRIKMRDNGEFTRVRVSHPDGKGEFREPRVRRVVASTAELYGTANSRDAARRVGPEFRAGTTSGGATIAVWARFRLRNDKAITLECEMRR